MRRTGVGVSFWKTPDGKPIEFTGEVGFFVLMTLPIFPAYAYLVWPKLRQGSAGQKAAFAQQLKEV